MKPRRKTRWTAYLCPIGTCLSKRFPHPSEGYRQTDDIELLSEDDAIATNEGNHPFPAHLPRHIPNLERLNLHLYKTLQGKATSYTEMFSYLVNDFTAAPLHDWMLCGS